MTELEKRLASNRPRNVDIKMESIREPFRAQHLHIILALNKHPDRGGNTEDMAKLNMAYDQALKRNWTIQDATKKS